MKQRWDDLPSNGMCSVHTTEDACVAHKESWPNSVIHHVFGAVVTLALNILRTSNDASRGDSFNTFCVYTVSIITQAMGGMVWATTIAQ